MLEWTLDDGKYLIGISRQAIKHYGLTKKYIKIPDAPAKYLVRSGAFVTVKDKREQLLGCIGRPYPSGTLLENIIQSAVDAAYYDPRFAPLDSGAADSVLLEVSILSPPEEINFKSPDEILNKIKVGRDGIIIEWALGSGLLLPQVPVEEKWDVEEYISYGCLKAGADRNLWKRGNLQVYRFTATVFSELEPNGSITRVNLET
ncbi:MAG: TIGR00296 family protein [Nitrososphaerota archaeon]|nr:TIGR00296 family protein [Nitrososphaerota archaeon]